jgi:hypothetical protein
VFEFFKDIKEESEKSATAWNHLLQPMNATNDELDLSIAKLERDIAVLEGKPVNNLAISLAEAKVESDKLSAALEQNLENLRKLLKEQDPGYMASIVEGWGRGENFLFSAIRKAGEFRPVDDLSHQLTHLKTQQMGMDLEKGAELDAVKEQHLPQADQDKRLKQIRDHYAQLMTAADKSLIEAIDSAISQGSKINSPNELETLEQSKIALEQQIRQIRSSNTISDLTTKKGNLQTANVNADALKPFEDKLTSLTAQSEALQAQLKAVGGTEEEQVTAKALAATTIAITEVNKALDAKHRALTQNQKDQLLSKETTIAQTQEDIKYTTHFAEVTRSLKERIIAQQNLTAAVGAGAAAQRDAFITTTLAQATKDFPSTTDGQKSKIGSDAGALFDEQRNTATKQTIDSITRQINMEQGLATVQYKGAQAVRDLELEYRILNATRDKTPEQAKQISDAMRTEYSAIRALTLQTDLYKISQEASAATRLANTWGGTEAMRKAQLQNKYDAMTEQGQGDLVLGEQEKDRLEYAARINEEADQTAHHYSDQREHLDKIIAAMQAETKLGDHSLETAAALRNLELDRLHVMAQQNLALGTMKGGWDAFLLNAKASAKAAGQIMYEALNSSVDKVSDQLTNLLTGQKTSWGQMFKELGTNMEKETIKSSIQQGLSALGGHFGIPGLNKIAMGKADGSTEAQAIWTRAAGADGGNASGIAGAAGGFLTAFLGRNSGTPGVNGQPGIDNGIAGGIGGFFGALLKGFGGGRAGGGDVDPASSYLVGENAPEIFTPRTAGTITPLNKAMGGQNHYYTIDARGAALGVENRIARSIDMAHSSAIQTAVRATNERAKRVPEKGR